LNNDLKLLIDQYEAEQKTLQSFLDDCLLEEDYEYAKYYRKNLWLIEKFLFNLYSLTDYKHAEKAEIKRQISNIEFLKKSKKDQFKLRFAEKRLQELNEKLDALNRETITEIEEKYDIENAIIRLLEKEINGFKIFILKGFNLYLDFTLIETEIIHISFTPLSKIFSERTLEQYALNYFINDTDIKSLKRNGFKLSDDENLLYINFDLKNKSTQFLISFLSFVFYKILNSHSAKVLELKIY
jgi:hypothetical protein